MSAPPYDRNDLKSAITELRKTFLNDLETAILSRYRLGIRTNLDTGLDARAQAQRRRFTEWCSEQGRASGRPQEDFVKEAAKQGAYTLINRLVVLRIMEEGEPKLRSVPLLNGGYDSSAYRVFRELAKAITTTDESEGYYFLLQLVFDDLAHELPGLFGPAGIAELVPIPAGTLRVAIEVLNRPELDGAWTDDMTLGWVYQYWNDPDRQKLNDKVNPNKKWGSGKIEHHEIASKTQMFTERYMVDWLLQNSLGPMWLAMCKKQGWTAEVQADGTLDRLEERRVDWRAKREAGEVELTALMPLHTDAERRWAYYVPQPIPEDAVTSAPQSVRDLKLIDPAVGSGHFLVVAFELLAALYREEARHRGEVGQPKWSDAAIVERILEHNLHGIDLDPRAVQIAAAALWMKAKRVSAEAKPKQLNLVATNLRLAKLPDDDPALVELRREVERETGIPGALTDALIDALKGADYLGSLLKIDSAVDTALQEMEGQLGRVKPAQGDLMTGFPAEQQRLTMSVDAAKESLLSRLEGFLSKHSSGDDLGLRLRGEQLATGVRFVRLVKGGSYDLVVANPPYQGAAKMAYSKYIEEQYEPGKADLYAAFLLRGLQLVRKGGVSAMLTMRNWMFVNTYWTSGLRQHLLETYDLRLLHDLSSGAFEEIAPAKVVVSVVSSVFWRLDGSGCAVGIKAFNDDTVTRPGETHRKRAATLCHVVRHEFDPAALKVVPEWPLVYWWDDKTLKAYCLAPKMGQTGRIAQGISTTNDKRFFRRPWEITRIQSVRAGQASSRMESPPKFVPRMESLQKFVPLIKGAAGRVWVEPLDYVCRWAPAALGIRTISGAAFRSPDTHFLPGVAYVAIGANFRARWHRFRSVCQNMGTSIFDLPQSDLTCALNSQAVAYFAQSLNPGVHFEVGDAKRLPFIVPAGASQIGSHLENSFTLHESHREPSVEFTHPGSSNWEHAQQWAQDAVDRPKGDPLPSYFASRKLKGPNPTDHLSFALGVALGRFGPNQQGILNPAKDNLAHALPDGICFLDGTLGSQEFHDPITGEPLDSLGESAAAPLHAAWATHGPSIDAKRDLRTWLQFKFFAIHKAKEMYENRPIHWPLCSENKTFVAWVNIHRMNERTLSVLRADHLARALTRLDGRLEDLTTVLEGTDQMAKRNAEPQVEEVRTARNELDAFMKMVERCADKLPPPTNPNPTKSPLPEVGQWKYAPDLDDGVMINSAPLWPLLLPLWKSPKDWWTELSLAKSGSKDYDWSHLAMRYWPTRVDQKCQKDPSLGVAHGCFWAYHPARAWIWELRLQDEIDPNFRIEEASYRGDGGDAAHRAAYLRNHVDDALAAVEKEASRRLMKLRDAISTAELQRLEATGMASAKASKQAKALAKKTTLASLRLLEPGLWTRGATQCLAMERKITKKQKGPFQLLAPDAPPRSPPVHENQTHFPAPHP